MKKIIFIMLIGIMIFSFSGCTGEYDDCALIEGPEDVLAAVADFSNTDKGRVAICDMAETNQWQLYACTVDEEFGYYLYAVKDDRGDFRIYGCGYHGGDSAEVIVICEDNGPVTLAVISDGTAKTLVLHNDDTGEEQSFQLDKEGIASYLLDCDWDAFSASFIDAGGKVIEH